MKAALLVVVLAARAAHGAPPFAADVPRISSELAFDGASTLALGYAAPLRGAGERLALAWWADLTWVIGDLDASDHRVRGGVDLDLVRAGRVRVRGAVAAASRATANTGFTARAVSTELGLDASVALGRVAAHVEAGVEQTWVTYVAPSDTYRELVHAGASAGWHATAARAYRAGLAAGVRVGRAELVARGGWLHTGRLDFLPAFYVGLGVAVGL